MKVGGYGRTRYSCTDLNEEGFLAESDRETVLLDGNRGGTANR